ncbi:MAG: hemerythrin domain-containing protein [Actinobacteria bacterium]|nr:hemerythrin domain-containing protein [Actinomycetota bacterium]MCA1722120.1 hemerythrin domain-containing protein [Actinomycetota bacterium]
MSELSGKGIGMLLAIHGAVRRDLGRVRTAAAALADPGIAERDRSVGVMGLARYWDCFAEQLHHHQTIEDTEVFPYVRSALRGRACEVLDDMAAEHEAIDDAQAAAEAALEQLLALPTAGNAMALGLRLRQFDEVVTAHLAHEEEAAVPLIVEGFDDEYWTAFMGRRQQDGNPDAFLPWVLDSAPAPLFAAVTGEMPPPVVELLIGQWRPAHDDRVAALPR